MLPLSVLFVLIVTCAALYSIAMVMRYYDAENRWFRGSGLDIAIMLYLLLFCCRQLVAYLHERDGGIKYLDVIYWGLFFVEHIVEAFIWSLFAVTIQLRRGKRVTDELDLFRIIGGLALALAGLGLVILFALFLSSSLDKTITIMRQLSLVLTVTLAVVEYTALWVKSCMFANPLTVLKPLETKLIFLSPTTTLIVGIAICGVPVFTEEISCIIIELLHALVLCLAIMYTWHLIASRNGQCQGPGSEGCASRVRAENKNHHTSWGSPAVDVVDLTL